MDVDRKVKCPINHDSRDMGPAAQINWLEGGKKGRAEFYFQSCKVGSTKLFLSAESNNNLDAFVASTHHANSLTPPFFVPSEC